MRTALFVLGVFLCCAATELPAAAHAVLERSSPRANASLANAPERVDLWFSEPVDAALSSARLLDSRGREAAGPGTVSSNGRQVTLTVPPLGGGLYTVRWRVLSVVDGHTTSGVVLFGVGTAAGTPPGSELSPDARDFDAVSQLDAALVVFRWIGFLTAFLLAGVEFFRLTVLGPGLGALAPSSRATAISSAESALRRTTVGAAIVLFVGLVAEVTRRSIILTDAAILDVVRSGALWHLVWETKPGWSALVRAGAAALLLISPTPRGRMLRAAGLVWGVLIGTLLAALGGPAAVAGHMPVLFLTGVVYGLISLGIVVLWPYVAESRPVALTWVAPATSALLLAGFTVNAHAWGNGPIAVAIDWLHLVALAMWIGGLASLLLVLRASHAAERPGLLRLLVPRFSGVAGVALAAVVATGVYSAWLHMPGLRAFTTTVYGRILLIKLALVIPLASLGAINRFVMRPRLESKERPRSEPPHRFRTFAASEIAMAVAILLVVAALTAVPPARLTDPATATTPGAALRLAATSGDLAVALMIDPPAPGPVRLEATATASGGRPIPGTSRMLVRATKLDEDLTPVTITLTSRDDGRYEAVTGELALPAFWEVELIVRRPGVPDVAFRFPVRLGTPALRPVDPFAGRLLTETRRAVASARTWRQIEQIADGSGGSSVLHSEIVRPDRLHYRTAGNEGIVIGNEQFQRTSAASPWTRTILPEPFRASGLETYLKDAERSALLGRSGLCGDEACRVVLWDGSGGASFAAWIGQSSRLLHRLLMIAPSHYMTLVVLDFNTPLRIDAPR